MGEYFRRTAGKFPLSLVVICYVISLHCCAGKESMTEDSKEEGWESPPRPRYNAMGRSFDGAEENAGPIKCSTIEQDNPVPMGRGLIDKNTRWESPVQVYTDPAFTEDENYLIGINFWELENVILPCVKYHWHAGTKTWDPPKGDHIFIRKKKPGEGCNSGVGRGNGRNTINLVAPDCLNYGTVVHEVFHALGIHHEQNRPDRDEYVEIKWDNIDPRFKHAFAKLGWDKQCTFGVPYNINSVMHYHNWSFNINGERTMYFKKGPANQHMGYELTNRTIPDTDIKHIRRMYNCPE